MPKVLLIQPTQYGSKTGIPCKQRRIFLPGLALPLLAACTPSNWEVKIYIEVVDDLDFDEECDIVGIGAMGHAVFRAIDIAKQFRKKGKTVFMGGYMASIIPDFIKDYCDSIVIGDGEISYPRLLKDYEKSGNIQPVYNEQLENLNDLPLPRYDLLLQKKIGFLLPVQAGRGCPYTCSFCSIACIYNGRYMFRPVKDVMRDITYIKKLGCNRFYLIDDNIASNPDYLFELANQIKPLKMMWAGQCSIMLAKNPELLKLVADSGCRIISLGIESISQEGLDDLNKNWVKVNEHEEMLQRITSQGILPATEMIVGTDGDTIDSIKETYKFIMKNDIPIPKFYIMTPMPATTLYKELKNQGRILHENYKKYTAASAVFQPKNMTPEDLERMYWWLYKKIYTIPNILKRTILHKRFFRRPFLYLFVLMANLNYLRFIRRGDTPNVL